MVISPYPCSAGVAGRLCGGPAPSVFLRLFRCLFRRSSRRSSTCSSRLLPFARLAGGFAAGKVCTLSLCGRSTLAHRRRIAPIREGGAARDHFLQFVLIA